jgi:Cys-tRNA(Pro)/Cys-tRNA(Cys) deacylase
VARKVGLPNERVFKTLLARGDRNGPCFAIVPSGRELDLKALARLTGDRKAELVALKEVQPMTGYIRGGVTVLGAKKEYPAYLDESALGSTGSQYRRACGGTQILLAGADDARAVRAKTGPLTK